MKETAIDLKTKAPRPADPPINLAYVPVMIPQGDSTYLVKPGKPVQWLTPTQFAIALGAVTRSSVYRYIESGLIPEEKIRYVGPRRILIDAGAVALVLEASRAFKN